MNLTSCHLCLRLHLQGDMLMGSETEPSHIRETGMILPGSAIVIWSIGSRASALVR